MSISRLIQMGTAGVSAGGGGVVWTDPDLANASYDSVSLTVSTQESQPNNVFFKPDGLKMYVLGQGDDEVNEYDLSTAWSINSAVHNQNFSVAGQEIIPTGISFKPDGSKMFIVGFNDVEVLEYNLSTNWDISTALHIRSFSVSSQDGTPMDLAFNTNGTKMYIAGFANDTVFEYDLSTAWDISSSSVSYNNNFFSTALQEDQLRGLAFNPDGNKMYVSGAANDTVFEYDLSTNFDVSTASYNNVSFLVSSQTTNPAGLFFKSDGSKMYIVDIPSDTIYQYSTVAAAAAWTDPDLINASYDTVLKSVANEELSFRGLFLKPDGTKLYVTGSTGDDVNEYNLSTAWDVSTSVYSQNKDISTEEINPSNVFFKPDGTKMYVLGRAGDDVNEYNLSTAWNVTTAVYSQNKSIASQDANSWGLFFKPDGTKMYVCGITADKVFEYDLSTAWDVTTALHTANQDHYFGNEDTLPRAINFNPDGSKMWMVGDTNAKIFEYDLSTNWDVTTANYNNVSLDVSGQITDPFDFRIKSDGSKIYVGGSTNIIYQYST